MTAPTPTVKPIDAAVMFRTPGKTAVLAQVRVSGLIVHLVHVEQVDALTAAGVATRELDATQWASAVGQARALGAVVA